MELDLNFEYGFAQTLESHNKLGEREGGSMNKQEAS